MKRIVLFLVFVCLFWACASPPPPEEEKPPPPFFTENAENTEEIPPPAPPVQEKAAEPEPARVLPLPDDGLASPVFAEIPPEAKDYLAALAEAFRGKDGDFLIAQGEAQYEKEQRFRRDEDVYLAMLYRIGTYSAETHYNSPDIIRLDYTQVETIEYSEWEENGPTLKISGRLYLADGSTLPCGIVLLWRLIEPKILGVRPDKGL